MCCCFFLSSTCQPEREEKERGKRQGRGERKDGEKYPLKSIQSFLTLHLRVV